MHTSKCAHDNSDDLIGQCDEGSNCTDCYQMLVISLLSKDQNLFNLSKAFFPTNSDDRPQFVTITYRFKDTNETKVWYWSEKGSFFVYPLQTFEYLSLFFGKASAFFSGSVTVTLDQDCLHAEHFMQHLTQRVSKNKIINLLLLLCICLVLTYWVGGCFDHIGHSCVRERNTIVVVVVVFIIATGNTLFICTLTCNDRKPISVPICLLLP